MNIRALLTLFPIFLAVQGCYASSRMSFEPGAQDAHQDADTPDHAPDTGTPDADAADVSDVSGEDAPDDYGNIVSIQHRGDYVYMVGTGGDFVVVDVSDPANPVEAGYLDVWQQPDTIFLQGDHVFIASYQGPFHVIDVSNAANPVEVGSLSIPGHGRDVFVSGSYAYTTSNTADLYGLYIIDVSDVTDPRQVGFHQTDKEAWGVWVAGGYAYVNGRAFWIIDVSSPENMVLVGECASCAAQWDLFVRGGYAYTVGAYGVKIVDISNPSHPSLAGEYDTVGRAYEIFVLGDRAYVAEDWEGLRILDVSDVRAPRHLELFTTGEWTTTVVATDNYIYVGDSSGLRIFPVD